MSTTDEGGLTGDVQKLGNDAINAVTALANVAYDGGEQVAKDVWSILADIATTATSKAKEVGDKVVGTG